MNARVLAAFGLIGCAQEYHLDGSTTDEALPEESRPPMAIPGASTRVARGVPLTLDGTASFDPDFADSDLEYFWELVPGQGGNLQMADTPHPVFWSTQPGVFEVSLTVTDIDGIASENPAIQTIEVTPWRDLEVVATWDRDVDLDVHLIGPDGQYYSDLDCFFGNPNPEWGTPGYAADNPTLTEDDESSGGPERILLEEPPPGLYAILVQYYNDRGTPTAVSPHLEVYTEGQSLAQVTGPPLTSEGQVWVGASIDWPSGELVLSYELTTHTALGGDSYND